MDRADLHTLASIRLLEAKALLAAGLPDGAYYLAGYAIECALKACIAKATEVYDFPPPPQVVSSMYTHDLLKLIGLAGLDQNLKRQKGTPLDINVALVANWSERSWYLRITSQEAQDLITAIEHRQDGVLQWVQQAW